MNLFFWRKQAKAAEPQRKQVVARYDAAQTSKDYQRHWANADGFSADRANTAEVRRTLRNRARYEVANNSLAQGMVLTLSNDVIGTGPRLQVVSPDERTNALIEKEFAAWAAEVRLAEKLHVMRQSRATDGEAFALLVNNPKLNSAIKLDVQLVEADRITGGTFTGLDSLTDGVILDALGNPVEYLVAKSHPGDGLGYTLNDFLRVPAEQMIHWFRPTRPGQHRGIPEITSALHLFADLRRYTLAVIRAAENAADISLTVSTDKPANGQAADVTPSATEIQRGSMAFLPEGWTAQQIKAEQPTTTYQMFKREILAEIGRCLSMPYNIAACDSSSYNYSSGRLDHQTYFKAVELDRFHCELVVLARIFAAWLAEARAVFGVRGDLSATWYWNAPESIDPTKEASAQDTKLKNMTATYAEEWAKQGRDYQEAFQQIAREKALMKELGLTPADVTPTEEQRDEQERQTQQ